MDAPFRRHPMVACSIRAHARRGQPRAARPDRRSRSTRWPARTRTDGSPLGHSGPHRMLAGQWGRLDRKGLDRTSARLDLSPTRRSVSSSTSSPRSDGPTDFEPRRPAWQRSTSAAVSLVASRPSAAERGQYIVSMSHSPARSLPAASVTAGEPHIRSARSPEDFSVRHCLRVVAAARFVHPQRRELRCVS